MIAVPWLRRWEFRRGTLREQIVQLRLDIFNISATVTAI